jgi:hypothetical protein
MPDTTTTPRAITFTTFDDALVGVQRGATRVAHVNPSRTRTTVPARPARVSDARVFLEFPGLRRVLELRLPDSGTCAVVRISVNETMRFSS